MSSRVFFSEGGLPSPVDILEVYLIGKRCAPPSRMAWGFAGRMVAWMGKVGNNNGDEELDFG